MDTSGETNPDLESFREQWRAEVRARQPATTQQASSSSSQQQQQQHQPTTHSTAAELAAEHHLHPRKPPPAPAKKAVAPRHQDYEDDYVQPRSFDAPNDGAAVASTSTQGGWTVNKTIKDPVTALDHYEKAVEKEAAGSLGDSLKLYRKAFRVRLQRYGPYETLLPYRRSVSG